VKNLEKEILLRDMTDVHNKTQAQDDSRGRKIEGDVMEEKIRQVETEKEHLQKQIQTVQERAGFCAGTEESRKRAKK
jgi:hypothetical protein